MSSHNSLPRIIRGARHPPADPLHLSFRGKTVLVTGANSGLGLQAAIKYAALGASTLILAVRTTEKGEQARSTILAETKCRPGIFIIETVELSTFASVKGFAERVLQRVSQLHIVQLAAGISSLNHQESPDGFEMALQVNVLSPALLALLLMPTMRETSASWSPDDDFTPHLSFVNSIAHLNVTSDLIPPGTTLIQRITDILETDKFKQYYLVKLAGMFAMRGLVERLRTDEVVVNASCPGMCKTGLWRSWPLAPRIWMALFHLFFGRTAEQGARTLVSATATGVEGNGKFWSDDEYVEPTSFMLSERGEELYRETWSKTWAVFSQLIDSAPFWSQDRTRNM